MKKKSFFFDKFVLFLLKSRRWISLHEYQSKKILDENHLNVQRFQVVDNPKDAKRAGEELSMILSR
jgi:phosphoribosylaminoimidazole carboxylase (NCAIR synthetase)